MHLTTAVLLPLLASLSLAKPAPKADTNLKLIKSFSGPFGMFIQFQKGPLTSYHLVNVLPGEENQGLIIGLNGPGNPGNLAQQFALENGTLSTSFGAATYGDRTTAPADTGYPLAPLVAIGNTWPDDYLQFVPGTDTPETGVAFKLYKDFNNLYQLVYSNGTAIPLGFGHLLLRGRYSGVINHPSSDVYKPMSLLTYGP